MDVRSLFSDGSRRWSPRSPADENAIQTLCQIAPGVLPNDYLELLRYSNGGEGPIALPPLYFMLYAAEFTAEINQSADQLECYPGFFDFGSNGGLERIAFDTRRATPWPIIMYDPIAGAESAEAIAKDMNEFILAIGLDDGAAA